MSAKQRAVIAPDEREIAVGDGDLWEDALAAWDDRMDMDSAQEAADLFEEIGEETDEADAWAWCARSHYYLGDYAGSEKDQNRLLERGWKLGRRGVEQDPNHVGAHFWTACCLGSYIETIHLLKRPLHVPEIAKCLKRVADLNPDYYHYGLDRYLGQAISRQPKLTEQFLKIIMPDMGPDQILARLREAIEKGPNFVLTLQTLGELAYFARKDKKAPKEMLERLDQLDLDATPNLAPENHRDLPRAKAKLAGLR